MARKKKKAEPVIEALLENDLAQNDPEIDPVVQIETAETTVETVVPDSEPNAPDIGVGSNNASLWLTEWSLPSTETPEPPIDRRTHIERINE